MVALPANDFTPSSGAWPAPANMYKVSKQTKKKKPNPLRKTKQKGDILGVFDNTVPCDEILLVGRQIRLPLVWFARFPEPNSTN